MKKIKNISLLIALLLLGSTNGFAQWTQKASFGGNPRTFSMSFTIGNKVYVGGGYDGNGNLFTDLWEYNQTQNTWAQKADLPFGLRSASVAFSIGNKGYLGTGNNGATYLNDFWEYDPTSDAWTQKANFPGSPREEAVGFSIGTKGYVGTGQIFVVNPNNSFTQTFADFYEYDPATDAWTQKANFPGPPRAYAVGIACGGKGYVGLGGNDDQSLSYNDFYIYDNVTDTWTATANKPGGTVADAGAFISGTDFYVVGGINFPTFAGTASCKKFNTLTNTWSSAPNFGGGIIIAPVTGSINGKGYVGTGFDNTLTARSDWWEFNATPNVSVAENEAPLFQLYPVPATTLLTLQVDAVDFSVSIKDGVGKTILEKINERELDVSALAPGIYFIELKADGKSSVQRFLKE